MATLKYFTKGTGNPKSIYLRLTQGRKYDLTRSTGLLIESKYWNNKKGEVKNVAEFKDKQNLQSSLNDLRSEILNSFNDSFANGQIINSDWLKTVINKQFQQKDNNDFAYIVDYAKYYKECLPHKIQNNGKRGVTSSTLKKYQTVINKLKGFEKHRKKRLKLIDIDLKFHKDFIHYLKNVEYLNYNTIGKYLTFIKTIVLDAKEYGLKINPDIEKRDFRPPKEETSFITLNETEIEKILNYNFKDKPYLDNARNWLIIGVWTGARVSDLLNLTIKNIKNGFIEYTSKKTNQKIILPLHSDVIEILSKNNNEFPRKISSQKFNDYIKEVCCEVGLNELTKGALNKKIKTKVWRKEKGEFPKWKLVSTHICRRSFATNHYGELPTPVIMSVTGHTTEKMFLKYIGKTARDNAEVLSKYWNTQKTKRDRKPVLNVLKTATNE